MPIKLSAHEIPKKKFKNTPKYLYDYRAKICILHLLRFDEEALEPKRIIAVTDEASIKILGGRHFCE